MRKHWWQFGLPEKWPPKDVEEWLLARFGLGHEKFATTQDVFLVLKQRGDDCFEFMEEFSRLFDVDITEFDWTRYNYSEAEEFDFLGVYLALFALIGKRWPSADRPIFPIGVNHLIDVARAKKWFDQEPMPLPRERRFRRKMF
jgi:hypothetical protein